MKKLTVKDLCIAYLIRAVISIALYLLVKKLGLLDVNTVGFFAGTVMISFYLNIPSIAAFIVNPIYK